MIKKHEIVIAVIVVIIMIVYFFIKNLPSTLAEYGLSNLFSYNNYKTMIEIKTDNNVDFALVVDKKENILIKLCFNENSVFIDDVKIENKDYHKAISMVFKELNEQKKLPKLELAITKYNNSKLSNNIIKTIEKEINLYDVKPNIIINNNTISKKAKELNIRQKSRKMILINFVFYSNEIIESDKLEKQKTIEKGTNMSKETFKEYADIVYDKLVKYKDSNNIYSLNKDDIVVKIDTIPVSSNYFPTSDSWYYIKDGNVYAYIKFNYNNEDYSFCYFGSKENFKEGMC